MPTAVKDEPTTRIREPVKLLDKQWEFVMSEAPEVLFSGAFGAGKTRAGLYAIIQKAAIPGNIVGIFRETLAALKPTTLHSLLYEEPPVLPKGTYQHNKSDKVITIVGGGTIFYGGLGPNREDIERIKSLNLGSAFVDEATEMNEEQYDVLQGRLRNPHDPNPQLYLATNPAGPSHFLYKRFFENPIPGRHVIRTQSVDNVFLPDKYLTRLDTFTGQRRARYVEGEWVAFEGLVYDIFRRSIHLQERDEEWLYTIVGVDDGYDHPFAAVQGGVDDAGRLHVIREHSESGVLLPKRVDILAAMQGDVYAVDPSAASLIAEMRARGLNVVKANNERVPGAYRVQERFGIGIDGQPRMTLSPTCTKTIIGLETYTWRDNAIRDDMVKEMDDEMDALRYLVMHLDGKAMPAYVGPPEKKRGKKKREGEAVRTEVEPDPPDWRRIDNPAFWS